MPWEYEIQKHFKVLTISLSKQTHKQTNKQTY